MVAKPERRIGDRLLHMRRRLVRSGESFESDEDVEMEEVTPSLEPPGSDQAEPWAWGIKKMSPSVLTRLKLYHKQFPEGQYGDD